MGASLVGLATLMPLVASARSPPCCGTTTPAGARLAHVLDDSGIMQRWQFGWHVDWRTGEKDRVEPGGPEATTRCSALAAAMAERLGVYVLRPPEHPQHLPANAQIRRLRDHGPEQDWRQLPPDVSAQETTHRGELVLEAFENPH